MWLRPVLIGSRPRGGEPRRRPSGRPSFTGEGKDLMNNDNEYRYLKQPSVGVWFKGSMIAALIRGGVAVVVTIIAATMRSG